MRPRVEVKKSLHYRHQMGGLLANLQTILISRQNCLSLSGTPCHGAADLNAADESDRKVLHPVRVAVDRHRCFKELINRSLGQRSFRKSKDSVERQIAESIEPDFHTIKRAASANLAGAGWAHRDYLLKRTHGRRKAGASAQSFITRFAEFFGAYSGIVDAVAKASPLYGEVAYECLSIFFTVVLNKSANDTKIADTLAEMQRSFPKMELWVSLYADQAMKESVVQVYRNVIDFTREASIYFLRFWTRMGMAIGKPPSMGIDRTISIIQGSLAEVNSQATMNLHKQNQKIYVTVDSSHEKLVMLNEQNSLLEQGIETLRQQNDRLHQTIDVLTRAAKDLQDDNAELKRTLKEQMILEAKQKLEAFKDMFGIEYPRKEADVDQCKATLEDAFIQPLNSPRRGRHYVRMSMELLEACETYQAWRASSSSSLLVYSGITSMESRISYGYTHSWLSPAAVAVSEALQDEGMPVAFFSCHPNERADRYLVKDIYLNIIYQILYNDSDILRHKFEQLKAAAAKIQDYSVKDAPREASLRPFDDMLKEILPSLSRPITIILDRIEQCNCSLSGLMDALVELIIDMNIDVRIMLVIDPAGGHWNSDGYWDINSCLERAADRDLAKERVKARLSWDQERQI